MHGHLNLRRPLSTVLLSAALLSLALTVGCQAETRTNIPAPTVAPLAPTKGRETTYDQVTTETSGHAESVKVVYDPSKITYGTPLRIFFSVAHDPTQVNRQGPDVGTSYRSAIFFNTPQQQKIAAAYIAQLHAAHVFSKPIATELTPLKGFYNAEDYHQDYALNNPYILVCDRPKIDALKKQFPDLFLDYHGR